MTATAEQTGFDVTALRDQFPILAQTVRGKPLVYLDNGATTQKPNAVIEAVGSYYERVNSNVHRGAHYLSDLATEDFEGARSTVAAFLGASREEIIWTRGTTEAINLVAQCHGRETLREGDEVLITALEHHSNIVPWQLACERTGATLKVVPVLDDGSLDMAAFSALLTEKTRILATVHVSNALGTVNPVKDMISAAHAVGAVVLVDGAQAVSHFEVNVRELDADFYAFSGHKLFGPTGIGVLYGKQELLNAMVPYQAGGEMIEVVTFTGSTWNQLPYKFEAGTPNIAGAIGLGAAIRWLSDMPRAALQSHEQAVLSYAQEQAAGIDGLKLVGTATRKEAVMSFLLDGAHPNDVGQLLDQQGIAVRTGHHCTMPLMDYLGIPGTVRASFSIYNTLEEVDRLMAGLKKVRQFI